MKIIKAIEYKDNPGYKISRIFVDGFYQWLHYFSKDKEKLTLAFSNMFNLDQFYIAIIDNEIAGITACTDGKKKSIKLIKKDIRKHIGFIRGVIAYYVLKKYLENKPYPFPITEEMGSVEFVATAENYRSRGVASSIMKYIFDNTPYERYVLEVADTNTNAVNLYTGLGYTEIMRIKEKNPKQSGINYYLYLEYKKIK